MGPYPMHLKQSKCAIGHTDNSSIESNVCIGHRLCICSLAKSRKGAIRLTGYRTINNKYLY